MKQIILVIVMILFIGCIVPPQKNTEQVIPVEVITPEKKFVEPKKEIVHSQKSPFENIHHYLYTYEYDGCEYVGDVISRYAFIAHKGNCKFCVQRLNNK